MIFFVAADGTPGIIKVGHDADGSPSYGVGRRRWWVSYEVGALRGTVTSIRSERAALRVARNMKRKWEGPIRHELAG